MIRAIRSASPLAAFAILTSAIVAYAECSWVLWNDEVGSTTVHTLSRACGTPSQGLRVNPNATHGSIRKSNALHTQ